MSSFCTVPPTVQKLQKLTLYDLTVFRVVGLNNADSFLSSSCVWTALTIMQIMQC